MGIFNWASAWLGQRKELRELQARFLRERMPEAIHRTAVYPPSRFLGEQDIYAELVQLHVRDEELETLLQLVGRYFPLLPLSSGGKIDVSNDLGESLRLSRWSEFNGTRVDLLTNSAFLIRGIQGQLLPPPAPWQAFPGISDPDALGSLQGDIEYWWDHFWSPFWNGLSPVQREAYLTRVSASANWIDCIHRHQPAS